MKKFLLLFLVFTISTTACLAQVKSDKRVRKISKNWVKSIKKGKNPNSFYFENSGFSYLDDFETDSSAISRSISGLSNKLGPIKKQEHIGMICDSRDNCFEMGFLHGKNGKFVYVNGWRKTKKDYKNEVSFVRETESEQIMNIEYSREQRQTWMHHSNAHAPADLVNELYTPDALYFSGGKLNQGRESIIARYSYMKRPDWAIVLQGMMLLKVDEDTYFEIGSYQSSGDGIYLLIWQQQADGSLQIDFDFNF